MKLKNAAQDDRILRAQHACRHDGGDRVRGVVQAVQEVEDQRNRDQCDQQRQYQRGLIHDCALFKVCALRMIDDDAVDAVGDIVEADRPLFPDGRRPRCR
jgi:hypothetical protein